MKTRFTLGMAMILATAMAVTAQTPAPAPAVPAPAQAPAAPMPAPAPSVPVYAPPPSVPVYAPAPSVPPMAPMPGMPALAPIAPLDPFTLDLGPLDLDLDLNLDIATRLTEQSGEWAERYARGITDGITDGIVYGIADGVNAKIAGKIDGKIAGAIDKAESKFAYAAPFAWQDPDAAARAAAAAGRAQEAQQRAMERQQEAAQRAQERLGDRMKGGNEEALYRRGTSLLDQADWARAVETFDAVIQKSGPRADGATYWKAWALYKEGQKDPSLAALTGLETNFPKSRWLNDAKALEVEVKQSSGNPVSPGSLSDEELKLLALQGLMHSDPDAALPVLDKLLKGSGSPRLKDRALFVLSTQGNSVKARELVAQVARGASNPDLQLRAITYLGHYGADSRPVLAEIYNSSDEIIKRRILQSYMENGDKEHLLQVAKSDSNVELRLAAIQYLSNLNAHDEVWQLYGAESSADVKKQIIGSLYSDGFSAKVADIARTEKDPALRRSAIQVLSRFGHSGDLLASLYDGEKDDQNKKAIINGLHQRQDAKGLVDIARKETNPELKREIVSRLSTMKSKEATDYMVELLSK